MSEWCETVMDPDSAPAMDLATHLIDLGPQSPRLKDGGGEIAGEILVVLDRQVGGISFLPTGGMMGGEGPYSQDTKVYEGRSRKAAFAVIYHRGSAVQTRPGTANTMALDKDVFPLLSDLFVEELLTMPDEDFHATREAVGTIRSKRSPWADLRMAIDEIAVGRRKLEGAPAVQKTKAAARMAEETVALWKKERPELLDAVCTLPRVAHDGLAGPFPFIRRPRRRGALHIDGGGSRLVRRLFDRMADSPNFVLHPKQSAGMSGGADDPQVLYDRRHRRPFEDGLARLGEWLDRPESDESRRARARVEGEILRNDRRGQLGFLDLLQGRGVCLPGEQNPSPAKAMRAMLGPEGVAPEVNDSTLGEISEKLDMLWDQIAEVAGSNGREGGSLISFAAICHRAKGGEEEKIRRLFGEEAFDGLSSAYADWKSKKIDPLRGMPRLDDIQAHTTECLTNYIVGESGGQDRGRIREIMSGLVGEAARTDFIYFATQVGAEGLLKIGRAGDVMHRLRSQVSSEGAAVLPVAYAAVPSLTVGGWKISAVGAACPDKTAGGARLEELRKFCGEPPDGETGRFFMDAITNRIRAKISEGDVFWVGKKAENASVQECTALLCGPGGLTKREAEKVHALLRVVSAKRDGEGGVVEGQKEVREATADLLSEIAGMGKWDGSDIKKRFFAVDERTQTPLAAEAWSYRVRTGSAITEAMLHHKYSGARVEGEWFYLMAALPEVLDDYEKTFHVSSVVLCDGGKNGLRGMISSIQASGIAVPIHGDFLCHQRPGYSEESRRMREEERVKLEGKIAAQGGRRSRGGKEEHGGCPVEAFARGLALVSKGEGEALASASSGNRAVPDGQRPERGGLDPGQFAARVTGLYLSYKTQPLREARTALLGKGDGDALGSFVRACGRFGLTGADDIVDAALVLTAEHWGAGGRKAAAETIRNSLKEEGVGFRGHPTGPGEWRRRGAAVRMLAGGAVAPRLGLGRGAEVDRRSRDRAERSVSCLP